MGAVVVAVFGWKLSEIRLLESKNSFKCNVFNATWFRKSVMIMIFLSTLWESL